MRIFNYLAGLAVLVLVLTPLVHTGIARGDMSKREFVLDQSNTLPDGVNYATLIIEGNTLTSRVTFTVNALRAPYDSVNPSNFGLQEFSFNYDTTKVGNFDIIHPSNRWGFDTGANMDGFGCFQVRERTPDPPPGGLDRRESLVFTLELDEASQAVADYFVVAALKENGGIPDEGSFFFSARVAGFTEGSVGSHFIGGSTTFPAPGATLLGFIGLSTLAVLKRRLA